MPVLTRMVVVSTKVVVITTVAVSTTAAKTGAKSPEAIWETQGLRAHLDLRGLLALQVRPDLQARRADQVAQIPAAVAAARQITAVALPAALATAWSMLVHSTIVTN
jgi:hypothetical protein